MAIANAPEIKLIVRYPVDGTTIIPEGSHVNIELYVVDTDTGENVAAGDITNLYWGVWTSSMGSPMDSKDGASDIGFNTNPENIIVTPFCNVVVSSSVAIGDTETHIFACKIKYESGETYVCHAELELTVQKLHIGSDL